VLRVNGPRSDFGPPDSVQHQVTRAPATSARAVRTLPAGCGRAIADPADAATSPRGGTVSADEQPRYARAFYRCAVVEGDPVPSDVAVGEKGQGDDVKRALTPDRHSALSCSTHRRPKWRAGSGHETATPAAIV
jgi:hypothetical protein